MVSITEISEQIKARFWEKVERTQGCWLWMACRNKDGYGLIKVRNMELAHRVSLILHLGEIPPGMCVLHNCPGGDNPRCVNPAHLWLGTYADNAQDSMYKGTVQHGERHYAAKLTLQEVEQIRKTYKPRRGDYTRLGRAFSVSCVTIRDIITGKTWTLGGRAKRRVSIAG